MKLSRKAIRKIAVVVGAAAAFFSYSPDSTYPDVVPIQDWMIVMREAADQGSLGMEAVYHVKLNRNAKGVPGWQGFSAIRDPEIRAFALRHPSQFQRQAIEAIESVHRGSPDPTGGATLFENIEEKGYPESWDLTKIRKTVRIVDHTFFEEV